MSWQTAQRVPNTAFVLSGGASLEALQVGMLRAVYSSDVESILLPAPNPTQVQPIDFDHSSRLIGEALTATRAFLARRETAVAQGLWIAHRASILPSLLALRLEKEPPGSAAFERGWRAPLAYVLRREHLRRTVRIALLVGIVPTTVNQQDVIVRGDATAITWIRCSTNFVVPFIVSNPGAAQRAQQRAPGGASLAAEVLDQGEDDSLVSVLLEVVAGVREPQHLAIGERVQQELLQHVPA